MIGKTVSHYQILEKLSEGGMGVVYKAEDTRLHRTVALKFLPSHLIQNPDAKQRLVDEAMAASSLDYPNICTVHEISETDDGQIFIVMACYEGETLKEKLARGQLECGEAIAISSQVARGLDSAHKKGVIHRDIKPANIIITTDGIVKLLDFGLATFRTQSGATTSGSTLGTFAYMSPEQIRGDEVDHRTDLWSIGVTIYEMLAGERPFQGEHEAALVYEILNSTPAPLRKYRPDTPDFLQIAVSNLLQKERSARTSSAANLLQELEHSRTAAIAPTPQNSIAVLYFENMSSERDTDYFCAGITEDIITDLSKVKSLRVVPRNDVLPFRNKDINIRQLGEVLRASYVMEGSVRKAGNRIRITGQLTDVHTGYHVWAERFDRLLEDIFDVQNEVSGRIVTALQVSLTEPEKASLHKKPTDDLRAYDFYMRGKELVSHRGQKNVELAIQMFERAIALDPGFVGALSGLAEACSHMFTWYCRDQVWLLRVIETSERTLALDPGSVNATFALGTVYFHQNRLSDAQRVFDKLIYDHPDFYEAFIMAGMLYDLIREYDKAIGFYKRACELRPYSEEPWVRLYDTYRMKEDGKLAEDALHRIVEIGNRRLELNPADTITRSRVATCYAQLHQREDAIAEVRKILDADPNDGHALFNVACTLAWLGEKEEMLECLRKSLQSGAVFQEWVKQDPDFALFRNDPDFQSLIREFQ